jgi:hypothetical protein
MGQKHTPKPKEVRRRREVIPNGFEPPVTPPKEAIKIAEKPTLILPDNKIVVPEKKELILPDTEIVRGPTIVDKIKAPAAKYVFKPHPMQKDFKTTLAWQTYWETEKVRWIEGHGGLNGHHYMYLSQWKIKIGAAQVPGVPLWREDDEYVFAEIEEAEKFKQEIIWLSRREYGKTVIFAYEAWRASRLYPTSTQLLTAADKDKIFTAFTEKIIDMMPYMHPEIRPETVNLNQTRQQMLWTYKYAQKDGTTTPGRMWGIETNETPNSPSNVSSKRAKFLGVDEIGLHRRRMAVLGAGRPDLDSDGVKDGMLLMTGTVEYGIPADSLKELSEMIDMGKKTGDLRVIFTPHFHGKYVTNGRADYKKAIREWEKEYEKYEKAGDRIGLMTHVKNHPPDIETALGIGGGSTLPESITAKLFEQSKRIQKEKPPISNFALKVNLDKPNGVEAVLSKLGGEGTVVILEHPQDGILYQGGIDPIPGGGTDMSEERSKHALIIYKPVTHTPVAYYLERHLDIDYLFANSVMLQKYYNNCKAQLEVNKGEVLRDRYLTEDYRHLLADTPKKLKVKFAKQQLGKGYYKNDNIGVFMHTLLIKWLEDHWDKIWFEQMLTDLSIYLKDNTDLLDAFLGVLLEEEEQVRKLKDLPSNPVQTRQKRVPVYDAYGRLSFKWVEVRTSGNLRE